MRLDRLGVPMTGVGRRWGPRVPALGAQQPGAPSDRDLDRSMERVAALRWPWAQPWHPGRVTAANRDETVRRTKLFLGEERPGTGQPGGLGRWQPSRHPAMCMWAASAVTLLGWTAADVRRLLGLACAESVHAEGTERWGAARGSVRRGHGLWRARGAWPWAAFDGDPPGGWHKDPRAATALQEAVRSEQRDAHARAEGLAGLLRELPRGCPD